MRSAFRFNFGTKNKLGKEHPMSMKNLSLFAAAALAGFTTSALAADMPVKAAPRYAPAVVGTTWTGLYAGLNVGYGFGRADVVDSTSTLAGVALYGQTTDLSMRGVIGGGQIGYNWQFANWLLGVEADYQGSGQKGTTISTFPAIGAGTANTESVKLDSFGTVRGRLGLITNDTNLWYFTGGWVYGRTELTSTGVNTAGVLPVSATSRVRNSDGWTIGGGVEAKIVAGWTAKVEYLYMDLGSVATAYNLVTVGGVAGVTNRTSVDLTDHIVRVGVNYKFF